MDAIHVKLNVTLLSFMAQSRSFFPGIPYTAPAFQIALEEVNAEGQFNMTLVLLSRPDLITCEDLIKHWYLVPEYYYDTWNENGVLVLFLSGCEENAELRILAREWNILLVGTTLNGNNPHLYPTVVSFTPGDAVFLSQAYISVFDTFSWMNIVIIHDNNSALNPLQAMFPAKMKVVLSQIAAAKALQYNFLYLPANSSQLIPYENLLQRVKPISRIICLLFSAKIVRMFMEQCLVSADSHYYFAVRSLSKVTAHRLQMVNSEYVFIAGEPFKSIRRWGQLTPTLNDGYDRIAEEAFPFLLQITGNCDSVPSDEMQTVMRQVRQRGIAVYNALYDPDEEPNPMTMAAYYAVRTISKVFAENEPIICNGRALARKFYNRTFAFPGLRIFIDNAGIRMNPYCTKSYNRTTKTFDIVMKHYGVRLVSGENRPIDWQTSDKRPPKDVPVCGYLGDSGECLQQLVRKRNLLALVIIAIGCLVFCCVQGIRWIRKRNATQTEWWNLQHNSITYHSFAQTALAETLVWNSIASSSTISAPENERYSRYRFMTMQSAKERTYYCKGHEVVIQRLRMVRSGSTDQSAKQRLQQLRHIKSDNLVRLIGILEEKTVWIFVTENMPRGTLDCFMEKGTVDADLRVTFLYDLLKGTTAIHGSPFARHGYLSPSVCLIDRQFVVRIADCGFYDIIQNSVDMNTKAICEPIDGNFVAPELVSFLGSCHVPWMLAKHALAHHDIFAIGRIISWTLSFSAADSSGCASELMLLADLCQSGDRSLLPNIRELLKRFREMTNVSDDRLVESLLQKMETYNSKLEQIVHDRTMELRREQTLSMELLQEMLPKIVLQHLVCGITVQAELFEEVTVSFAIVAGFVDFCVSAAPTNVVNVLNIVFTMFDGCMKDIDAYKVETVSDCYMTASGLPIPNGNKHATEICRLALDFRDCFMCIPCLGHGSKLQLKTGIESGPCAAGVVGNKRPRYCLFGNTVNVASRLAYSCEALKIHIGKTTAQHVQTWHKLHTIPRGMIFLRGAGEMLTFWLERGELDRKLEHSLSLPM